MSKYGQTTVKKSLFYMWNLIRELHCILHLKKKNQTKKQRPFFIALLRSKKCTKIGPSFPCLLLPSLLYWDVSYLWNNFVVSVHGDLDLYIK